MDIEHKAFWVKDYKIYSVELNHINYITSHLELFNIERSEIERIYKGYNEKRGFEGKARIEIIKNISKQGWIRVRHYTKPSNYWTL